MKKTFTCLILILASLAVSGQVVKKLETGQTPGKGSLSNLEWLTGYWTGPGLGGTCEEVWLPARDGQMMGTFRFFEQDKLVFSEVFYLIEKQGSLSLKLKHYGSQLEPWEEKKEWVTFALVRMGKNEVWFDGLTIKRTGNRLQVWVELNQEGKSSIARFDYKKKRL